MSATYASEQQLRTLTPYAIDCLNSLNERDEKALTTLRTQRAVYETEIAAIDDVMRDLEATIARRQAKARGDVIGLLPIDPADDSHSPDAEHGLPGEGAASFDSVHAEVDAGGHS